MKISFSNLIFLASVSVPMMTVESTTMMLDGEGPSLKDSDAHDNEDRQHLQPNKPEKNLCRIQVGGNFCNVPDQATIRCAGGSVDVTITDDEGGCEPLAISWSSSFPLAVIVIKASNNEITFDVAGTSGALTLGGMNAISNIQFTFLTSPDDPPCTGVCGDPHVVNWSGDWYTYRGEWDLGIAANPSFDNGTGLRHNSYVGKMGLRIGTDVLEVANYQKTAQMVFNGQNITDSDLPLKFGTDGKYVLESPTKKNVRHRNGLVAETVVYTIQVEPFGSIRISLSWVLISASLVEVKVYKEKRRTNRIYCCRQLLSVSPSFIGLNLFCSIKATMELIHSITRKIKVYAFGLLSVASQGMEGTSGLMGAFPEDRLIPCGGSETFTNTDTFGIHWQVNPNYDTVIFSQAREPQWPNPCCFPVVTLTGRALAADPELYNKAETECALFYTDHGELENCIEDVLLTGDTMAAGGW